MSGDRSDCSVMLIWLVWNQDAAVYWCVWGRCLVETSISRARKNKMTALVTEQPGYGWTRNDGSAVWMFTSLCKWPLKGREEMLETSKILKDSEDN